MSRRYELSMLIWVVMSASHLLSVSWTLEYVRILSIYLSIYQLIYLFFLSTSIVSLMMVCVRLLSELMILLLTQHGTKHLLVATSWDNLWVVVAWSTNQNCWKTFPFFIRYVLILKSQDLVLKVKVKN